MDHTHLFKSNRTEAPQGDAMARESRPAFSPLGAPLQNSSSNDSLSPVVIEKKSEKKSITPVVLTPERLRVKDYTPDMGPKMYDWFCSKEKYKITRDTYVWKSGEVSEKVRNIPNPPPHFSEFARTVGTTWKILKTWAKNNKEFADYYEACQDIIQEFMIDNGVTGGYSGQFGIFAAKNITKMKDVQINKNENYNMKEVLDALEKGVNLNESNEF